MSYEPSQPCYVERNFQILLCKVAYWRRASATKTDAKSSFRASKRLIWYAFFFFSKLSDPPCISGSTACDGDSACQPPVVTVLSPTYLLEYLDMSKIGWGQAKWDLTLKRFWGDSSKSKCSKGYLLKLTHNMNT